MWPDRQAEEAVILDLLHRHVEMSEQRLANMRAALVYLEAEVINMACDDPGRTIGRCVLLPLIRERVEAKMTDAALQVEAQAEAEVSAPESPP